MCVHLLPLTNTITLKVPSFTVHKYYKSNNYVFLNMNKYIIIEFSSCVDVYKTYHCL